MTQSTMTDETTIGIDLGDRKSHICVLSVKGEVLERQKCQRQWLRSDAALSCVSRCGAHNPVAVTLRNVLDGTLLVAGVYWLAYLRPEKRRKST